MRAFLCGVLLILTCASTACLAQQDYVGRYDAFTGFSYLSSPKLNLDERGFNGEFGVNVTRWLAIGGDFSGFSGHSTLYPNDLATSVQQQLSAFAPLFPPGYALYVPFNSTTFTYTAGPQFNYRGWKPVTFFIRPGLGAMHETARLKPADPIQSAVVGAIAPSGSKSDTVVFYGVGGGIDLNTSDHVGIRLAADFVRTDLFHGLLKEPRNSVRLSIGPTFRWGRNVR